MTSTTFNSVELTQLRMLVEVATEDLENDNQVSDWDASDLQIIQDIGDLDGRPGRAQYALAVKHFRRRLGMVGGAS